MPKASRVIDKLSTGQSWPVGHMCDMPALKGTAYFQTTIFTLKFKKKKSFIRSFIQLTFVIPKVVDIYIYTY